MTMSAVPTDIFYRRNYIQQPLCTVKDELAFVMSLIFFGHVINENEEKMQEKFCLTFGKTGNIIITDEWQVSVNPVFLLLVFL